MQNEKHWKTGRSRFVALERLSSQIDSPATWHHAGPSFLKVIMERFIPLGELYRSHAWKGVHWYTLLMLSVKKESWRHQQLDPCSLLSNLAEKEPDNHGWESLWSKERVRAASKTIDGYSSRQTRNAKLNCGKMHRYMVISKWRTMDHIPTNGISKQLNQERMDANLLYREHYHLRRCAY